MTNEELIALLGKVVDEALTAHREARELRDQLEFARRKNEGLLKELRGHRSCGTCFFRDGADDEEPCVSCWSMLNWAPEQAEDEDCADCKVEVSE